MAFGDVTRVAWAGCFGGADGSDGGAADCLALKGFAVTQLTLVEGVSVDVYNLHGEAGATQQDQDLSQADYEQLAAYIDEHSKGHAVLLGGDTNLHTNDGHPDGFGDADAKIWSAFLAATGLHDVCEVITHCESAIDKMALRSSAALTLQPLSHRLEKEKFRTPEGADLSDHLPLHVDVEWKAPAGKGQ
jgi:endonuclease/exonuclease/phosphatase family metal-dependent hydrolase